ncbi:MAG: outer membrane protein OmpK [Campylobacterota bacterium]|nr:outer membrane protein OmpK [Campylobacterota bacterium]
MIKKILLALLLAIPLSASDSLFKPTYSFLDTSLNYLAWSEATKNRIDNRKNNFYYLELEGGAGFDWGETYFFFDIENPNKAWDNAPPNDIRVVFKPIIDIKILDSNFEVHIQDYFLDSKVFYVNNLVTGFAYKYTTKNFWIRPFLGTHYQNSNGYTGFNGYMTGWTFNYNFNISTQKFALAQWHEFEFARDKKHYQNIDGTPNGDGRSYGTNGAISAWWLPIESITAGVQYRYADYKLGEATYQDGIILTVKYNF